MTCLSRLLVLATALCAFACSDDSGVTADAAGFDGRQEIGPDGPGSGDGDLPPDAGPASDGTAGPCQAGARACTSTETEKVCQAVGGALQWVEQPCPAHSYCIVDRCEPACLDECTLDAQRTVNGVKQTCKLYSATAKAFVQPGSGTRDRVRLHEAWLQQHLLANGYVASTLFADTTYTGKTAYLGTVDAAEWTGVYLTTESLRLKTTRAPAAEHNVETLVERLHQLFQVTANPGYMARFWAPKGVDPLWDAINNPTSKEFHETTFNGGSAFWHGWTSRDMYHGVILGYTMAYDALSSEKHRQMIRDDVLTLAQELLEQRVGVPVSVKFNLFGSWQTVPLKLDMQYVVLTPSEMNNGEVTIQIGTDADPSDYNSSEMMGLREFFPNFTTVLKQVPVIGPLLPPILRPSSVMVLANILRLAMHVTEGDPTLAAEHTAFETHYNANFQAWLDIMKTYAYYNQTQCWKQYFGITIAYHPIYGLIHLEQDPARRALLQTDVLAKRMWSLVASHKNLYFTYISAGVGAKGLVSATVLQEAGKQLEQFVPPPKACINIDNSGKYPVDPSCPENSTAVLDVADRDRRDFIWQHDPFRMTPTTVEPRFVHPGVDYLVAYWLGRHYGHLTDDAPDTCLRWTAGP